MGIFLGRNAAPTLLKRQGTSIFRGNSQTDIIQLSKQNLYRDLPIQLSLGLTLAGASNTVAATLKGDEWAAVARIRLVANSSDVLCDISGDDLWWINRQMIGTNPRIQPTLGDGVTANPTLTSTLILPVWLYRAVRPMEGAYDAGRVSDFRMEVTYNPPTSINAAANAVYATTPTLQIFSSEVEPNGYVPPFVGRIYKRSDTFNGVQAGARVPLDVGPFYRGFLFNVIDPATGADSGTLLSNVKLVSGSTVHRDISASVLYDYGSLRDDENFGQLIDATGIARNTNLRISPKSTPLGWLPLNLCQDGYMTEAIASATYNDFYLEFQTTGNVTINTIAFQLFNNRFYRGVK